MLQCLNFPTDFLGTRKKNKKKLMGDQKNVFFKTNTLIHVFQRMKKMKKNLKNKNY